MLAELTRATPSLWDLLRRIPSLRWVAIQVGLAALLAALARAPRLGRPRPDPPSGADRPAEHAVALGALLARASAAREAHELLDRYRALAIPANAARAGPPFGSHSLPLNPATRSGRRSQDSAPGSSAAAASPTDPASP